MLPGAGTVLGVVMQRGPAGEGPWLHSGFLVYLFAFQSWKSKPNLNYITYNWYFIDYSRRAYYYFCFYWTFLKNTFFKNCRTFQKHTKIVSMYPHILISQLQPLLTPGNMIAFIPSLQCSPSLSYFDTNLETSHHFMLKYFPNAFERHCQIVPFLRFNSKPWTLEAHGVCVYS